MPARLHPYPTWYTQYTPTKRHLRKKKPASIIHCESTFLLPPPLPPSTLINQLANSINPVSRGRSSLAMNRRRIGSQPPYMKQAGREHFFCDDRKNAPDTVRTERKVPGTRSFASHQQLSTRPVFTIKNGRTDQRVASKYILRRNPTNPDQKGMCFLAGSPLSYQTRPYFFPLFFSNFYTKHTRQFARTRGEHAQGEHRYDT